MKVKKFIAPSMPEAMKMIRDELGKDAVILNSKVVQKGGIFGLFAKKNIEVIAAVDPQPVPKPKVQKVEKEYVETKIEKSPIATIGQTKLDQDLIKEIQDLKALMKKMAETNRQEGLEHYPEPLKEMNRFLFDQEFEHQLRKDIMDFLLEKWYVNRAEANFPQINSWVKEFFEKKLSQFSFGAFDFSKKYVNVVGPTGVGKTTTLAKIAAHAVLKHGKKIAFITTDTYRIAAIEQLKTYAKILNAPLEVAYTLDDFVRAKERFSHFDLVLIDTAGRNFRNKQYVEDLKSIINFNEEIETMLVLALPSKYSDMIEIVNQFSLIKIDKLIFTKVDETSKYGSMINLIMKYGIGVAYLTNGQNVPDDILEATPESILNTIFGVIGHERSS